MLAIESTCSLVGPSVTSLSRGSRQNSTMIDCVKTYDIRNAWNSSLLILPIALIAFITWEMLMDKDSGDPGLSFPNQSQPILAGQHWHLPTNYNYKHQQKHCSFFRIVHLKLVPNKKWVKKPWILCKCQESRRPLQGSCPARIAASFPALTSCSPPQPSWLLAAISETAETTLTRFLKISLLQPEAECSGLCKHLLALKNICWKRPPWLHIFFSYSSLHCKPTWHHPNMPGLIRKPSILLYRFDIKAATQNTQLRKSPHSP